MPTPRNSVTSKVAPKQQSISSFFSSQSAASPKPTPPAPSTSHASTLSTPREALEDRNNETESAFAALGLDLDSSLTSSGSQQRKRSLSRDQEVGQEEFQVEPKVKRLRKTIVEDDEDDTEERIPLQERPQINSRIKSQTPKKEEPRVTHRTAKYLFSSSKEAEVDADDGPEAEDIRRKKEKLHQRFVKKLGRPDSLAEIKRRNHFIEDAVPEGEDIVEDGEAEEEQPASKGRKGVAAKKSAGKLTPMEKQILEIKRKHLDTVLLIEVGYKYRFFGEDARTAAKELSIVCIPGKFRYDEHPSEAHLDRFASASIPTHRLHVHVKRLVAAGHKVGVVRQIETAALKAVGDNRNAPFVRELTNVYTKGTYIDDVEGLDGPTAGPSAGVPATGHLLCLTETNAKGWGTDEKVHVGIVAVQPATGDIIYDDFEDGFMRSEIETRLLHIAPCEFLIVGDISKATEKLVQHLSGSKTNVFGDRARVERVEKPKTMAAQSYSHISNFYADKLRSGGDGGENGASNVLDKVHSLSEHVTICLSAMITHLTEYGLQHVFDLTKNFQAFSARSYMLLNGNTLNSLEIYRNQTDRTERGSLFWVLDQTQTRFGQRLLRKWVGRPLLDKDKLEERINAVEELKAGEGTVEVDKIRHLLSKVKVDLERSLIRIYYKKCTRSELLTVLQTLQRIGTEYARVTDTSNAGFKSPMINEAITVLPKILDDVVAILEKINPEAAKNNDKYGFFREDHETDQITGHRMGIASVEYDLDEHRKVAAQKIRKTKVEYVTSSQIEYLIVVENSYVKNVPASWAKISGTKQVSRFHTPEVIRLIRERDQHKEALAAACDDAFTALLTDISSKYQAFRDCIQSLAILDCLVSFAEVANRPDYVKPTFTTDTRISVVGGRHPMVEQILLNAYVPNDISLSTSATRALLITGPNMGGKSSYVRSVALIAIMAQCGSYVPAASAELGMLDAVFTRMGAFDNMMAGESTFMVELSETADILKQATPRSLVVLDELGRGTSTHDGVAIAQAVLDYVVRDLMCLTLFITHYQNLATVANSFPHGELRNVHMRFTEEDDGGIAVNVTTEDTSTSSATDADAAAREAAKQITFLYEVTPGVAHRSYGLNVARLANVPERVIEVAAVRSREMERVVGGARLERVGALVRGVLFGVGDGVEGRTGVGDGGDGGEGRDGEEWEEERWEALLEGVALL